MSYPENLLAQDEQVVKHLHPHWITLVKAVFWAVVLIALMSVGSWFAADKWDGNTAKYTVIAVLIVGVIALIPLTIAPFFVWRTTHYVFTTHRVLIRRGVLHRVGRDIALGRISDVAFSESLLDRIVNAGTLTIESAGENGQEVLVNVPHSADMQQQLNHLIEADSGRRMGRPNPGY
jgi:uncharacterized membrane protein YdbT with pleckstrin-like domain